MKRILRIASLVVILTLLLSTTLYAAWVYKFPTTVTDTSNVTRAYYPVDLGYGTGDLVSSGKILATGLDTNMQIGSTSIEYMLVDDRVMTVIPSLPANGSQIVSLYTGYTPNQTSLPIITGSGGFTTITDHANLEFATQFLEEWTDTYVVHTDGTVNELITKANAWKVVTSDVVNGLAAYVPTYASEIVVDAAGVTLDTIVGADWGAQTFTATADTLVSRCTLLTGIGGSAANMIVSLRATAAGVPTGADLAVSPLTSLPPGNDTAIFTFNCPYKLTNGTVYAIVIRGYNVTVDPVAWYNNANPYAGGSRFTSADSGGTWTVQAGDDFRSEIFDSLGVMAVTGITTAEYDFEIEADTVNLTMDVAGVQVDTRAIGAGVPGNANNWILGADTPYIGAYSHTTAVGGVSEKILYQPNAIVVGTTLPNRAVPASYDGTITWGANANVTINYGEMESYASTTAAATGITGGFDVPSSAIPATWFARGGNAANLPFYDSFSEVSTQTGQPVHMIYFIGIIGLCIGVFLLLATLTRSALLACLGFNIVLFVGSSMTIVPMWIPFVCMIVMFGIIYLYKQVAY